MTFIRSGTPARPESHSRRLMQVDPPRVLADELAADDADRLGQGRRGLPVVALAPADDPLVGRAP